MNFDLNSLGSWAIPGAIILTGYLAGVIFRKVIHSRLKKYVADTSWKLDNVLFEAIESQVTLWFLIIAIWVAVPRMGFTGTMLEYTTKGLEAILILSITVVLSRLLISSIDIWSSKQNKSFPSTVIFSNLIRITVYTIGIIVILDSWDISIAPFLTALGVGGLAISLALKDTLSDLFSGLHILLSEKVSPGDFIELDSGHAGYVMNITWRNTTLMERTNNVISIPNSRLSTAILKNYDTNDPSFSLKLAIGVAYDSDLDLVERVTIEEAKSVLSQSDEAKKDFEPLVRYNLFAESSINFNLIMRVKKYGDQHKLVHELIKNITRRYRKEGIEIPFPIRTIFHHGKNLS